MGGRVTIRGGRRVRNASITSQERESQRRGAYAEREIEGLGVEQTGPGVETSRGRR